MTFTAQQIASFLKGSVVGNPDIAVSNFSKIEEGKPGTITFLSNPKYTEFIYTTQASIVLVNNNFEPKSEVSATLIKVEDAYKALALLLNLVEQSKVKKQVLILFHTFQKQQKLPKMYILVLLLT
jgi:UDP-3-O-[3-hydroxymyristoyl] glucosamine N-acyltransferase